MLSHSPKAYFRVALSSIALLVLLACTARAQDTKTFGEVEYYGYAGIDLTELRSGLSVHAGDPVTAERKEKIKGEVRAAVLKAIGRPATDVETVCCDAQGHIPLYIGLPGTNYQPSSSMPLPPAE